MPKSCVAVNCHNHVYKGPNLSFFRFPKDQNRRERWCNTVKRINPDGTPWKPSDCSRLCNAHFVTGKPSLVESHPDYVPSIFTYTPGGSKGKGKMDRFDRATKRLQPSVSDCVHKRNKLDHSYMYSTIEDAESENSHLEPAILDVGEAVQIDEQLQQVNGVSEEASLFMKEEERKNLLTEISALRNERDEATSKVSELANQLKGCRLNAKAVEKNDERCQFFTGMIWCVFLTVFEHLAPFMRCRRNKDSMPLMDQFFISLVKLRIDPPFEFLAYQCGIGKTTVIDIFWRWIDLSYVKLQFLIKWPEKEALLQTLPSSFRSKYPRLVAIIDCFEIFIDYPKNLKARAQCYSNYKKHSTVKVFIACTPAGQISFISKAWGGRVSDIELVRNCGFLDRKYFLPGDQILADRGFTLQDDFATVCGAELIIPSFTKGKSQLSARDVESSRTMSSIRIHIERVIGLLKNRYKILQGTLPIRIIKSVRNEAYQENIASIDKILVVCAALTNTGSGIVTST